MFHRISEVKPTGKLTFDAIFINGEKRRYDVTPLLSKFRSFQALQDVPGLFERIHVDAGGYAVAWDDELDLECEDIWELGVAQPV